VKQPTMKRFLAADGKIVNVHGIKIYEPTQNLFTLSHKGNSIGTDGYSRDKHIGPGDETFKKVNM
jgi:hypothetical protein